MVRVALVILIFLAAQRTCDPNCEMELKLFYAWSGDPKSPIWDVVFRLHKGHHADGVCYSVTGCKPIIGCAPNYEVVIDNRSTEIIERASSSRRGDVFGVMPGMRARFQSLSTRRVDCGQRIDFFLVRFGDGSNIQMDLNCAECKRRGT